MARRLLWLLYMALAINRAVSLVCYCHGDRCDRGNQINCNGEHKACFVRLYHDHTYVYGCYAQPLHVIPGFTIQECLNPGWLKDFATTLCCNDMDFCNEHLKPPLPPEAITSTATPEHETTTSVAESNTGLVIVLPFVMVTPSSISVNEGEPVRLVCEVTGSEPLNVSWTLSGETRLPLGVQENGTDLVIAAANSSHPGTYVCSARNVAGIGATLTVHLLPSVTITPSSISVNEGEEVKLVCEVTGSEPLNVSWTLSDGSPLPLGVQKNRTELVIAAANSSHPGTYVCTVSNLVGSSGDEANVTVHLHPSATISPSSISVNEGEKVRLVCEVTGSEPLNVSWTLSDGSPLPLGAQANETDLVIAAANSSHPGTYVCSVRNVAGIGQDEANVTVHLYPSATVSPSSISVNEGELARLVCEVTGSEPLNVSWTLSDGCPLPLGVQENGTELVIAVANSSHPGMYVCSVSNLAGTGQDEANVTVHLRTTDPRDTILLSTIIPTLLALVVLTMLVSMCICKKVLTEKQNQFQEENYYSMVGLPPLPERNTNTHHKLNTKSTDYIEENEAKHPPYTMTITSMSDEGIRKSVCDQKDSIYSNIEGCEEMQVSSNTAYGTDVSIAPEIGCKVNLAYEPGDSKDECCDTMLLSSNTAYGTNVAIAPEIDCEVNLAYEQRDSNDEDCDSTMQVSSNAAYGTNVSIAPEIGCEVNLAYDKRDTNAECLDKMPLSSNTAYGTSVSVSPEADCELNLVYEH